MKSLCLEAAAMDALTVLVDEHRVILQVLDCLEKIARQARDSGTLDAASAREAVEFFRTFADRCHHAKEEDLLFPLLEKEKGFSTESGPTAVMRAEHIEGRACVRRMAESAEAAEKGGRESAMRFAEAAEAYLRLLRDHIGKEDHCLFPNVGYTLSGDDHRRLLAAYDAAERKLGAGTHGRLQRIADGLAARWGVAKAPAAAGACCGHRE
jgi:hemerythrin-like domain-containing protein